MDLTLRDKQKVEAIKRMSMLGIMGQVRKDFKCSNKIYYSERQSQIFNAILYWVDNNEMYVNAIKEFEVKHNALVYHAQLTHTYMGEQLALCFVSCHEEEWDKDKDNLMHGEAFVYVKNFDDDDLSEFGYIGIKPSMGGILRTC